MGKPTDIEISLDRNDMKTINDFITSGGNIYKEFDKVSHFYVRETLMTRACREERIDIVQILLNVYERDYKICEKFVSNEKDKDFLLKYVFIAWSEEEIKEVLLLNSMKSENSSKMSLVFLADRRECVLVPIVEDKELMFRLYKNGFLTINSREQNGGNPGYLVGAMNRLDLLKRMIAIGLNYKDTPRSCEGNDLNFIGQIISHSKCIGLIKYCLTELNLGHEDLLQFTAKNKSIQVFEYVLEYVSKKNGSGCKKDYIQKYCEKNDIFCAHCGSNRNFILIAHLFTVYDVKIEPKTCYFMYLLKEPECVEYIKEILEIEKDNFDDLLASIEMDVNISVLEQTWRALDKTTLKAINKNNVKIIIISYISLIYDQSEIKEQFHMMDPLAIYDEEKGNTALFIALERNCEPLIRHLISKGADLLHKNKEGYTTLTAACRYCSPEIIRLLLRMNLSLINEIGSNGYYPLTELITRGDCFVDVFNKIIKMGADIKILDQFGNTLLHNAVVTQNIEFVKACLEAGLDPSIKGYNDDTALHTSTKSKSLEIFDLILNTGKVDIESKNYRGNTILHNVCKSYHPHFLLSFIEKTKPNINALNNEGQPPIYFCFDKDKFKKLLDMGADTTLLEKIDVPFNTGASFEYLTKCFSNPDFDLSTLADDELLYSVPRMHIPNNRENLKEMLRKSINAVTPLDWNTSGFQSAAATNNLPFIQNMFKYGDPQIELKNDLGETAIFGNLRYVFHKEVLKYLIEKGADVNVQNNEGNSLIFVSVFAEGTEILLKAGASTKILNKKGKSALHHAAQRNDLEICLLLLKYGADINLVDEDHKKPSDLCTYKYLKDFLLFISDN